MANNRIVIGDLDISGAYNITAGYQDLSKSLLNDVLEIDTLDCDFNNEDTTVLNLEGERVVYYFNDRQRGVLYVDNIKRTGTNSYHLYAVSAISRLDNISHTGGIYTGQTVEKVVKEICGPIPVYVKSNLKDIALYGWLPYSSPPNSSARDNLNQVLFAIGASLGTDLDGILRVEQLWDGVITEIEASKVDINSSVTENQKVSSISVMEHQYVQGDETATLFDGTTQYGDTITFDEPMHSLSATGFSVLESGANYAILSAGTGTLTGKKYIHNTRKITKVVDSSATENEKTKGNATLVSLANSNNVADRMVNYYKNTKSIQASFIMENERPGHVVKITDPYDKADVVACIASMNVNMSSILKADAELLVGFLPPSSEEIDYEFHREVLTGAGTWQRPDGVTSVTCVLISGAQGGKCGKPGGTGGEQDYFSYTNSAGHREFGYRYGEAGAGGEGGEAGHGGKILQGSLDVTNLPTVSYQCGVGGAGAPFDADNLEAEGSEGGDTTFGPLSSAAGSVSETGYTDTITGDQYALGGTAGTAGGDSAGKIPGQSPNANNIKQFQPAPNITGPDGTIWSGGNTQTESVTEGVSVIRLQHQEVRNSYGVISVVLGSGAAVGSNGATGGFGTGSITTSGKNIYATPADGLAGANATAPSKAALTMGGIGGNGGGGGSPGGLAGVGYENDQGVGSVTGRSTPGPGGNGSAGGQGGDGAIILYYSVPVVVASGPLVTKTPRWFNDKYGRRFIV